MNINSLFEQEGARLRDMSSLLWSFKQDLKAQGFTEEQAFQLVKDYQKAAIMKPVK